MGEIEQANFTVRKKSIPDFGVNYKPPHIWASRARSLVKGIAGHLLRTHGRERPWRDELTFLGPRRSTQ
jgi:hypothetical protein